MFVLFFPLPCRFGKKPCRIHAKKPDCQGNAERHAPQSDSLDMLRNEQEEKQSENKPSPHLSHLRIGESWYRFKAPWPDRAE